MRRAGLLKEIIQIIEIVDVKDQYGATTQQEQVRYVSRARVNHKSGSRNIEADEVVHNYTKTFTVRMYVPVEDFDKILYRGKYYRVLDIEPNPDYQEKYINTELIND